MARFFDTVDAVYVINLDHRTDRWESFQERWKGIIPPEKLIRSSAVLGVDLPDYGKEPWFTERTGERARSWAGAAGCVLSHKNVIRDAQKQAFDTIVILEDDAVPSDALLQKNYNGTLVEFLKSPRPWGILYLGFNKMPGIGFPVLHGADRVAIWQIPGVLATHAYVLHRETYPDLLRCLPEKEYVWPWLAKHRAIDNWYREFLEGATRLPVFAVLPRLVIQGDETSDIAVHLPDGQYRVDIYETPKKMGRFQYALCTTLSKPFRTLKNRLNMLRTHRRARKHGFPGLKRKT